MLTSVFVGVHAAHEHVGLTSVFTSLGGSREHHILGTSLNVLLGLVHSEEKTSGFYHVFSTNLVPLEVSGVLLGCNADVVTVNDEFVLLSINLDVAVELTVHGVVFEHVSHIVDRQQIVNTYNHYVVDVGFLESRAENEAADATETVNTYFNFAHNDEFIN